MNELTDSGSFESQAEWRRWLEQNYDRYNEFWLVYYKKQSGKRSVVYREALEEALCFGWIDGMIQRIDDDRYKQRFTPRREKSNWSETNIKLALRLESEGRMHESGLKFKDRWQAGKKRDISQFVNSSNISSFNEILKLYPQAESHFGRLSPSHQKQYILWIYSAKKQETRMNRISEAISLLEKGEKLGMK